VWKINCDSRPGDGVSSGGRSQKLHDPIYPRLEGEGNGIPQEDNMAAIRVMAFVALIALVAMAVVGDALAGEKWKGRTVWYAVKWEQVNVPGEEGHLVAVCEAKAIGSRIEGEVLREGQIEHVAQLLDIDLKTGLGHGHGYGVSTDRDGDKYWSRWEGKRVKGGKLFASYWEGQTTLLGGTGKFEGIQGGGPFSSYPIAPMQWYSDWELEVELPKR